MVILYSFLIVASFLSAGGIWTMLRARQTWNWAKARALVEFLDVFDEGGSYSVAIRYRYAVNGQEHVGDCVTMVQWSATFSLAQRKVNVIRSKIDKQGKLLIRYDPANPSTSVVEPGITLDVILYVAFAAGSTALFALILFLYA